MNKETTAQCIRILQLIKEGSDKGEIFINHGEIGKCIHQLQELESANKRMCNTISYFSENKVWPWQPIETAPKDDWFLAYNPIDDGVTCVGIWLSHYQENIDQNGLTDMISGATHWMPLPKPPKSNQEETKHD